MDWIAKIIEKFGGDIQTAKTFRASVRNEKGHVLTDESIYHALEALQTPYQTWEVAWIARLIEVRRARMEAASRRRNNTSSELKQRGADHKNATENWQYR